jgi:OOP family OmpA-OmpF porin
MTQGDNPRAKFLAASVALGLACTGAYAQIPGDSPGGSPQYRDATGVLKPGSGAVSPSNASSTGWTPPSNSGTMSGSMTAPASSTSTGDASGNTVPDKQAKPNNDDAWDPNTQPSSAPASSSTSSPRSAVDSDQMPLPAEPTAAGPASYGGYDPARESWIPYTSSGYIGISGGKPDLKTDCVAGTSCDDPDSGWSVYLGGQFNPYLGLQLGYLQLQDADRNGGDTKVRGVNISLTGAVPLGSNFSLNGRLGGTYGWTKTSVGAGVPAASGNEEGFGVAYGVGASWDFDRHWSVTLDWDRHRLNYAGDQKKDTDIASIGLRYRF